MKHFMQDNVSTIKRLLVKDYPPSSIFKELIQNADDAKAQNLHFGWISDWPDGAHPLLSQPVLFALNDGPFSRKDENSIQKLGQSGKASDVSTIGTFGLGMKSVFHLCEGFFYAASANQEARDGVPFVELLTPWENVRHIDKWEDQEALAAEIIMEKLSIWGNLCDRWFCVMIPLRRNEHLGKGGPIVDLFPEFETFFPNTPEKKIIQCFTPLLKSLEEVTFWGWNSKTCSPEKKWHMWFDVKGLKRTQFSSSLKPGIRSPIGGTVHVSTSLHEHTSTDYIFSGYETLLSKLEFDEIKRKNEQIKIQDIETGEYVQRKAEPHCAVMFSKNQSGLNQDTKLQIDRAVFLPLAKTKESASCGGNPQFRLILHGWYFLDAGRLEVLKRSESDRGIEEQWNEQIDELGVWPLFLGSLEKFVEEAVLTPDEKEILTEAVQKSEIFRRNKQFICSDFHWLRQVSNQGSQYGQWRRVEKSLNFLAMPKPKNGMENLPFEVFPNLPDICRENVVVFDEQARLTEKKPLKLEYGTASVLLKRLGSASLNSKEGLQYLKSFLAQLDNYYLSQTSTFCVQSMMRLIGELGINTIRRNKDQFFELLEKLPRESWVSLGISSEILETFVKRLPDMDLPQILLPRDLSPEGIQGGRLKWSTADRMLRWLVHDSKLPFQTIGSSALAIIKQTEGNLDEKQEAFGYSASCVQFMIRLIGELGINAIRRNKNQFWELLEKLPEECWVSLDISSEVLETFVKRLPDMDLPQILLPRDLSPRDIQGGKLKRSTADRMLRWLTHDSKLALETTGSSALAIIKKTEGTLDEKQKEFGHYELFPLADYTKEDERKVSWNELSKLFLDGLLFDATSIDQFRSIEPLMKAVHGQRFYTLSKSRIFNPFWTLFQKDPVPLGKNECFKVLNRCPELGNPEDRKQLLDKLILRNPNEWSVAQVKGLRYLLHGSKENFDDMDTSLWIYTKCGVENIQERLTARLMERRSDRWFVIPNVLGECLNFAQMARLKVTRIDSNWLEQLLSYENDLAWIGDSELSEKDRFQLLRKIESDEILKRLPIHKTTDGQLISIDSGHVLVASGLDFRVSADLEHLITLIERPADEIAASVYDKLLDKWTPETALKTALNSFEPSDFWRDILTSFQSLHDNQRSLSDDKLVEVFKKKPWIPTLDGLRAPQTLINREDEKNELTPMLAAENLAGTFFCVERIIPECREHTGYKKMMELLAPNDEETLKRLGSRFQEADKYAIGNLSDRISEHDFLDNFLLVFAQFPTNVMPTASIVKVLLDVGYQPNAIKDCILRPLAKTISKTRCKQFLISFKTIHEQANENDKRKIINVFNWYLDLLSVDGKPYDLQGLHLLNRDGQWKLSSEICLEADGIVPSDLLDLKQAGILRNLLNSKDPIPRSLRGTEPAPRKMATKDFYQYLQKFEGLVTYRTIGAFLSLLGDEKYIRSLAENYLYPEDLAELRNRIDWTPLEVQLVSSADTDDDNIHDVMHRQRFDFFLSEPDGSCYVPSLFGGFFKAQQSKDYGSLIIQDFQSYGSPRTSGGYRYFPITLRAIRDEDLEGKNVHYLLLESTMYLLKNVYKRQPRDLDFLLSHENGEQLDLRIAQQLILKHSMFYFKQLGEKRLTTIKPLVARWRRLEIMEEEIKIGTGLSRFRIEEIKSDLDELQHDLRQKLVTDADVQHQLLEVVRHKIEEEFQYAPDSIPFELFQNADDASMELLQMGKSDHQPLPDIFYMCWNDSSLIFAHLGRAINQFRGRAFSLEEGEAAGYNSDLEKMLVMSYSDKADQKCQVTGKFGLGFKSVFLVSPRPKVLSGPLGFEVVAGMYPKRLDQADRTRLKDKMKDKLDSYNGTIFEIGFEQTSDHSPEKVTKRFLKVLPVMLVFSRQIKQCHLEDPWHCKTTLIHSEKEIENCHGAFIANISSPFNQEIRDIRALVLRAGDFSALLLNLGPNGVCELPETLPTFWNLAPLGRERLGLGIAVNANFRLDVGRAQIAESIERHQEVAHELGQAFGDVLSRMHQASETNWTSLKHDLGLAADVTTYQMWETVWQLLGSQMVRENLGQDRERDLCKEIFWGNGIGMAELFKNKNAIPSRLHGDYKKLTRLEKIRWCAEGRLDSDEKVFKIISSWETFRQHIPANGNNLVSKSRIKQPLEILMSKKIEWNCVNIEKVLKWELTSYPDVSSDQAEKLGTIITPQFIETWDTRDDSAFQERELLVKNLKELRFQAASGAFVSCQHLLVSDHEDKEESMKAAFAPLESVLDSNHSGHAIAFFKACRGPIEVSVDTMEQWAVKPLNVVQQKALLKYLIKGEQGSDLQPIIGTDNTWLQDLTKTQAFRELKIYERDELIPDIVNSYESDDDDFDDDCGSTSASPTEWAPRPDVLEQIFDWWQEERHDQLDQYEQKVYPDGHFFDLLEDSSSGLYNNEEWLKTFLLGCLQTLGRTTHETKRRFVKKSERLIRKLAHSEKEPSVWLHTFDDLIDQQIDDFPDYQSNLRLFGLYVIGRRLTDYIHSIMNVNNFPQGTFSLRQILVSRTSELYQGGGPDAPPINRVLGIGAHFLIRELYRKKILIHEGGHGLCYVPNSRLRDLIMVLGCHNINEKDSSNEDRSKIIFNFLKQKLDSHRALFNKDFDIPLQVIAYDRELQRRFLGRELPASTWWAQEAR